MVFGTQPDDSANVPVSTVYSKENNTFPALQAEPGAYKDANSNQSSAAIMSFLRPLIVQKAHSVTGAGAKTLTCAFASNNIAGNSVVVAMGMGEVDNGSTITLAVTDSQSNSYTSAVKATQSTTLEAAIFYATNVAAGANTITITIAGGSSANTAIAVEIYEVWGIVAPVDQTNTGNSAGSTTPATGTIVPIAPNELAFAAISAAGGTITAGSGWTLDSTSLSPSGGNLVSFGAESQALTTLLSLTPAATLSGSNAWAMATASFKSVSVPIAGTVIAEPNVQASARRGAAYVVALFAIASTGGTFALSVFNAASAKNILIYSMRVWSNSGFNAVAVQAQTSNPAFDTPITPVNAKLGGPASALASTCTYSSGAVSPSGTLIDSMNAIGGTQVELLNNGSVIVLPAGANNGIVMSIFVNNTDGYSFVVKYAEY